MSVGSSLRVSAWAPQTVARNGRLVVVNLQWTPLDDTAALKINAKSDDVFKGLCGRLGCRIPPFALRRHLRVSAMEGQLVSCRAAEIKTALRLLQDSQTDRQMRGADKHELAALLASKGHVCTELVVNATDTSGTPYAWMTSVKLLKEGSSAMGGGFLTKKVGDVRDQANVTSMNLDKTLLSVGVTGRFKEPPLEICCSDLPQTGETREYCFEYPVGERNPRWREVAIMPNEPETEQSCTTVDCQGSTERIQNIASANPDVPHGTAAEGENEGQELDCKKCAIS